MKLKYYKRSLKELRFNKSFIIMVVTIVVVVSSISYLFSISVPVIETICNYTARSIAFNITNDATKEVISNLSYNELVEITKDVNGEISAISANVMKLNTLATEITNIVATELDLIESTDVHVPLSSIFQMGIFSGYGPDIKLILVPTSSVTSRIKSEFSEAGINQTRHSITLEIISKVRLIAPFYTSSQEYVNEITIAETIIVGDIPSTYYYLNGVTDLEKKDSLNLLE